MGKLNKQDLKSRQKIAGHLRNHSLVVLNSFSSKIVNLIPDNQLKNYLEIRRNFEKIL